MSRVIAELFDVEEERAGDVPGDVAGTHIRCWTHADGRERGVEEDYIGIVEVSLQPGN
jgi:hypothetical protein